MNLVVGATGLLGSEICGVLAAEGKPAKALVRGTSDPGKVGQLAMLRLEIVRGDLKDPSSLEAACRGVTAVISTASSALSRADGDSIQTVDLQGQINLIDAAKVAGVSRFILISFPHTGIEFPLQTAKRTVEEHLKASGINYTILQPTVFMEVWLSPALGFDGANAKARIYGAGKNKISWISLRDVARFAVAILDHPDARNEVIPLGGPEALSPLEVVKTFEQVQGRPFEVAHVSEQVLREQTEISSDPLQQSFAGLMLNYAEGSVIDMRETLRRFPVQLTSVEEYANASRAAPAY